MTKKEQLYSLAVINLGRDASPKDEAPDELGCADSVSQILKYLYPDFVPQISTAKLFSELDISKSRFARVSNFTKGTIIISPTGVNKNFNNPNMKNGHVGIYDGEHWVYSNNSLTGKWDKHISLPDWIKRYRITGGYKCYAFDAIN